jgi:hypothetical protein
MVATAVLEDLDRREQVDVDDSLSAGPIGVR